MKIGIITARYSVSGVPLAQARLATALAREGHEVDYVIGCVQSDVEVPQPEGSRLMVLSAPTVRAAFRPLCRYLREERPEIIFSAEDHLNAAVAIAAILTRSKVRISGSSRISPFDTYSDKPFSKGWVLKHLVRATAWRQNVMTCVSQGNLEQYRTVMPNITYHVAYNVVADAGVNALLSEPLAGDPWLPAHTRAGNATDLPVVLAAGTLETWKGFDNLIRAIGLLCEAGRPTRLIVLGEGSQRSTLENLVAELGLGDFVRLPGREANPYRFFVRASAFALSSHIESFGNVLVEAMLAGATPVATDCPTGPREVLGEGRYGYLVQPGSPKALAEGIAEALDNPLSSALLKSGAARFTERAVLARHEELLKVRLMADTTEGPQ